MMLASVKLQKQYIRTSTYKSLTDLYVKENEEEIISKSHILNNSFKCKELSYESQPPIGIELIYLRVVVVDTIYFMKLSKKCSSYDMQELRQGH